MGLKRLETTLLRAILWAASCAVLGSVSGGFGCGGGTVSGASAPPVSIPAPVSGRLTVTSPDEDGNSHVIGGEGAVSAEALVHVVNATQAESSSLDNASLRLVEAKLMELPDLCGLSFHACVLADTEGTFEIEIPASEGDEILVTVIDSETGEALSEELSSDVPDDVDFFPRSILSVGLVHNTDERTLYTLMSHNDEDSLGLVSIIDLAEETETLVSYAGPSPERMVIDAAGRKAAILDDVGEFIAKVDLTELNFDHPSMVELSFPEDLVMNLDGDTLFVATGGENASLVKIDFATMTVSDTLTDDRLQNVLHEIGNAETTGMDIIPFSTHVSDFDMIAFTGTYVIDGETVTAAVGLVDGDSMTLLAVELLPEGAEPEDVAFFVSRNKVLVTDSGNDQLLVYSFETDDYGYPVSLTLQGALEDSDGSIVDPENIQVYSGGPYAFVTAFNATEERSDTVLTIDLNTETLVGITPVGYYPSNAVFDEIEKELFVSTYTTQVITVFELTELLP